MEGQFHKGGSLLPASSRPEKKKKRKKARFPSPFGLRRGGQPEHLLERGRIRLSLGGKRGLPVSRGGKGAGNARPGRRERKLGGRLTSSPSRRKRDMGALRREENFLLSSFRRRGEA